MPALHREVIWQVNAISRVNINPIQKAACIYYTGGFWFNVILYIVFVAVFYPLHFVLSLKSAVQY